MTAPVPSDPAGEAGDLIDLAMREFRRNIAGQETARDPNADMASWAYAWGEMLIARLAVLQQERDEAIAKLSRNEKAMDIIDRAAKLLLPDIETAETLAASLQRRAETLTGVLTTVHDWLANSAFDEAGLPEALSIDDLVQIVIAALTPEQGEA